jgi:hypothetical protein
MITIIVEGKNDKKFFELLLGEKFIYEVSGNKTTALNTEYIATILNKSQKCVIIVDSDEEQKDVNLSGYKNTLNKCEQLEKKFGSQLAFYVLNGSLEDLAIDAIKNNKEFDFKCCFDEFNKLLNCKCEESKNSSHFKKAILTCYKRFHNVVHGYDSNDFFDSEELINKIILYNPECNKIKNDLEKIINDITKI